MMKRYGILIVALVLLLGMGVGAATLYSRSMRLAAENDSLRQKVDDLKTEIDQKRKELADLNGKLLDQSKMANLQTLQRVGAIPSAKSSDDGSDEEDGRGAFVNRRGNDTGDDRRSGRDRRGGPGGPGAMGGGNMMMRMLAGGGNDRFADRRNERLFTKLGLDEASQAKFKEIMATRGQGMSDVMAAFGEAKTPEERAAVLAHARQVLSDADQKLQDALGAEKYVEYQLQGKTMPLEMTVNHLAREAERSGTALTEAQLSSLNAAATQVASSFQYTTDLSSPEKMIMNGLTDESIKTYLAERKAMTDQFLTAISGSVSEEQVKQIQSGQERMDQFTEMMLNNTKAALNGEQVEGGGFGSMGGMRGGGQGASSTGGGQGAQGGAAGATRPQRRSSSTESTITASASGVSGN